MFVWRCESSLDDCGRFASPGKLLEVPGWAKARELDFTEVSARDMTTPTPPQCIATTGGRYCKRIADCGDGLQAIGGHQHGEESNLFKQAQWSADGTTVVTHNEDQRLRTFVLPVDLLDGEDSQPRKLEPYAVLASATHVQAYTLHPSFDLNNTASTLVLSSAADLPIRLRNALYQDISTASYPLVDPLTEAYISPSSLAFTRDGTHFVAGCWNALHVFDCSRDGSGPIQSHVTAASKSARKRYGAMTVGCKGMIKTLAVSSDGYMAAGTTQRQVGLYSQDGLGECITAFSVAIAPDDEDVVGGDGIMQVLWSPCGRYLYVAERQSDGLLLYDIRVSGKKLGCLSGRGAQTPQKLDVGIVPTANGSHEICAGGIDGVVRIWSDPPSQEGKHSPDFEFKAHDDPITTAAFHPSGSVLATCSGQRFQPLSQCFPGSTPESHPFAIDLGSDTESDDGRSSLSPTTTNLSLQNEDSLHASWRTPDNTLKLWSL